MNKKLKKYRVVYCIKNLKTSKVYIGSAENYWNRIWKHRSDLRANIHPNYYLQKAWNKWGEDCFVFGVIEELSKLDDIATKEQYWMNYYNVGNRNKCYNLKTKAYSNLGHKHSEETKLKMSLIKKGKPLTKSHKDNLKKAKINNHPQKGKIGKLSKCSKPILQYDLNNNFIKEWESITQCAITLKLHKSNIIMCLKLRIKQTGGYIFKYKKNL